jgi:phage gp29-like protein
MPQPKRTTSPNWKPPATASPSALPAIPYIILNFGPQADYPTLYLREPDQTDIPVMVDALAQLVPLGLRVEVSEVRDRLGFSDPAKDAECLGSSSQGSGVSRQKERLEGKALNREGAPDSFPDQDALDAALSRIDPAEQRQAMAAAIKPVIEGLQATGNIDEALNALAEAYPEMDTAGLQELLTRAMFVADIWGRLNA